MLRIIEKELTMLVTINNKNDYSDIKKLVSDNVIIYHNLLIKYSDKLQINLESMYNNKIFKQIKILENFKYRLSEIDCVLLELVKRIYVLAIKINLGKKYGLVITEM